MRESRSESNFSTHIQEESHSPDDTSLAFSYNFLSHRIPLARRAAGGGGIL